MPLYFVVVVIVFAATHDHSVADLGGALSFTGVYSRHDLLPVAWSLDDEVAFYLMLPLLYVALRAWPRAHERLWLGVMVVAAMCALSLLSPAAQPQEQAIPGGPITKFHLFGFGMVVASLHARFSHARLSPGLLTAGGIAAATLLLLSGAAYVNQSYFFNPVCGLGFALVVGSVAFSDARAQLTRVLSWAPVVLLGDVSYGIYLWHEPVHHVLYNLGLVTGVYMVDLVLLASCTVALATGTYYLIEKPALGLKKRWATEGRWARATATPGRSVQLGAA